MTYLALIHGAKGLIYWCYYNMRVLPQYPEMWAGMKKIGAEVKTLSPVLLSPEDLGSVRFTPDTGGKIHTKLKRHEGREYLIAVNVGAAPCEVTFDLGHPLPPQVNVLFEDQSFSPRPAGLNAGLPREKGRTAPTEGTRLRASFKPLEVHVYELGR